MTLLKRLFSLIGALFLPRKRTSSKPYTPSQNQQSYLAHLIRANNTYRGTPRTRDDWIRIYCKGRWNARSAFALIRCLKYENRVKSAQYQRLCAEAKEVKRTVLYASDLSVYGFCPNAFYFVYTGNVSRNLYELEEGRSYHGERRGKYKRASLFSGNKNSQALHAHVAGVQQVRWFRQDETETLHRADLNLVGKPDGVLLFTDQTAAVVEVKSRQSVRHDRPSLGDVMQACAYLALYQKHPRVQAGQLRDVVYLLYIDKSTQQRHVFPVNSLTYQTEFEAALHHMQRPLFNKHLFQNPKNQTKCSACGFRSLCRKRSETTPFLR